MHARTWKRVPQLVYPFFLLTYAYLMFRLQQSTAFLGTSRLMPFALFIGALPEDSKVGGRLHHIRPEPTGRLGKI